jgi:Fe-S-cluster containining protein
MKKECRECGICCLDTEMVVSEQDIELVLKNNSLDNLRKQNFIVRNNEGNFQLKNVEAHCFFFDVVSKSCKIYDIRPQGCRFYPLIYDGEKKICVLDSDCPRKHLFYQNPHDYKNSCKNIRKFLKEQLKIDI